MFKREVTQLTEQQRRELLEDLAQRAREALRAVGKGRPIRLPPDVARAILDDVATGDSYARIVERYRPVATFSRWWLGDALRDGRVERMARAGQP